MSKSMQKKVNQFIKKHSLTNIHYTGLKDAAKALGFTTIEFNPIFNDQDVATVIENLGIGDAILQSRGFTYADKNYRLVFINEDLNEEEKILVLSHELGHIACEHFATAPIIGKDVKEEHEANEFSHYLLKHRPMRNFQLAIGKHKKLWTALAILLVLIVIFTVIGMAYQKEQSYYGEYYITQTGNKYHQSECIHVKNNNQAERLTKEQFASGDFEPCGTCLPQG